MPSTSRRGHHARASQIARLQSKAQALVDGGATVEEAARAVGRTPATLHRWGITAAPGAAGRIKADMFGLDGTLTYEQDARGRLVPHVDISLLPTDPDEAALGYLAMMCDGATSKDDVGFGMSDAMAGHLLAARIGQWDETDRTAARHIAYHHRRQLEEVGLVVPEPDASGKDAVSAVQQRLLIREAGGDLVMQGKAPPDALRHAGWEYDRSLPGWRAPVGSEAATIGFEAAVLAKDDAVLGELPMSAEFDRDAVARIDAARTVALEDRDCDKIVSWAAAEAAAASDAYMTALKQAWGTDSEETVEEALRVLVRPVVPRSEWVDASDLAELADEHGTARERISALVYGDRDDPAAVGHLAFMRSVEPATASSMRPERLPHVWERPDGRVEVVFPSVYGWRASSGTALPEMERSHADALDCDSATVVADPPPADSPDARRHKHGARLRCVFPQGVSAGDVIDVRRFAGTATDGMLPSVDSRSLVDAHERGTRQAESLANVLSDPAAKAWLGRWKESHADWRMRDQADRQRHMETVEARAAQCRQWGADDRSGTAMNVTVREVTASKRQRGNTFTRCEVEFPDGATGEVTFRVSRGSKAPSMAGLKGTQIAVTGEIRPAQPVRGTGTDIRSLKGRLATTEWQRI